MNRNPFFKKKGKVSRQLDKVTGLVYTSIILPG